jgi:hypothetical protein
VRERKVELVSACPAPKRPKAREKGVRLAEARAAAVPPQHRRLEAVQLEKLQRLCVVTCGDLDLVAPFSQQPDQRPEHEHVRRRGHVDPYPHAVNVDSGGFGRRAQTDAR